MAVDLARDWGAVNLADDVWTKLLGYARNGLPDCYDGVGNGGTGDYLYDFWPDLPWDKPGLLVAIEHLTSKPDADFALIAAKFGMDFRAELAIGAAEVTAEK